MRAASTPCLPPVRQPEAAPSGGSARKSALSSASRAWMSVRKGCGLACPRPGRRAAFGPAGQPACAHVYLLDPAPGPALQTSRGSRAGLPGRGRARHRAPLGPADPAPEYRPAWRAGGPGSGGAGAGAGQCAYSGKGHPVLDGLSEGRQVRVPAHFQPSTPSGRPGRPAAAARADPCSWQTSAWTPRCPPACRAWRS